MSLELAQIIKRPIALTEKASRIKADHNQVVIAPRTRSRSEAPSRRCSASRC